MIHMSPSLDWGATKGVPCSAPVQCELLPGMAIGVVGGGFGSDGGDARAARASWGASGTSGESGHIRGVDDGGGSSHGSGSPKLEPDTAPCPL